MSAKYCINCINYVNYNFYGLSCKLYEKIDLVDGKQYYPISCRASRDDETLCGAEGRYFVQKEG